MPKRLNTEKLSLDFIGEVMPTGPIIPRRYTLTHSDQTGELFLTIGSIYAKDKITAKKDNVIGEWIKIGVDYVFHVYLPIDGSGEFKNPSKRDEVFRRELPLALEAIRYGDSEFFTFHPELEEATIIVYFMSTYCQYHRIENLNNPD